MALHAAKLEKSYRLQRVLSVLNTGEEYSTRDLIQKASVCAVNSIISELRSNGIRIGCERRGDVWVYWIEKNKKRSRILGNK